MVDGRIEGFHNLILAQPPIPSTHHTTSGIQRVKICEKKKKNYIYNLYI